VIRFAEFELDSIAGELRRDGHPVRLERIPTQLLCLLVSRPGQLFTRAEIIERLWGKDVFLDTDNAINTAIRKIRIVLRDDPEQPRFISTLLGRGYRFVGELLEEAVIPATDPLPSPSPSPPATADFISNEGSGVATLPANSRTLRPRLLWATVVLLAIAAIVAGFAIWNSAKRSRSPQGRTMLAVLPFENMSGDPSQDYFVDGMTEEMIAQLGGMNPQQLGVIARTSAMHYKHTSEDVAQIARELGVAYVLEGSVRRAGDRVRVTAQLIQSKDQTHLWAQDYDRQMTDILEIQTAIASAIADEIRIALPAPRDQNASSHQPINAEAYEAYLRGLQGLEQRTRSGMVSAIADLTRSTALDPHYADAWAALSRTYSLSMVFNVLPSGEALSKARDAAMKAIALDDRSAVGHCTLAFVKAHYDFDWPGAEREFLRAIALNPSDPSSHFFYSNSFLSPLGRHDEAIAEIKAAIALDPLSFPIQSYFGRTLLSAGRPDEALAQFAKANLINPNSAIGHVRLARAYAGLARYEDAIAEEEKARILSGESPEAAVAKGQQLRDAFRQRGTRGYWEQQLQSAKLSENPPELYTGSCGLAVLYAQLRDREKAMTALNQAFKEHDNRLTEIGVEPLLTPLRTDPSFIELETRIGLPPSHQ